MRGFMFAGLLMAGSAQADIIVDFRDGAPKDRITITNAAACATGPVTVTLDLGQAPAGLIFDVTNAGAGVEVFQPVEVVAGADLMVALSEVRDGDQTLTVTLRDLAVGGQVALTVDLDDTGGGREITVSGSEIAGAMVTVSGDTAMGQGAFDETGQARVILASCTS